MEIYVISGQKHEVKMSMSVDEYNLLRRTFSMGVSEINFQADENIVINEMMNAMERVEKMFMDSQHSDILPIGYNCSGDPMTASGRKLK